MHGDDWEVGFTVGAIFEYLKGDEIPCLQEGRIGFSYRSGIEHDIRGSAQFSEVPVNYCFRGVFTGTWRDVADPSVPGRERLAECLF